MVGGKNRRTPEGQVVWEKRAKRYNSVKLVLSLVHTLLGWIFLLVIVLTGVTSTIELWAHSLARSPYLALLVFGAVIGLLQMVIFSPLSFYGGYVVEHTYQLSNQTLASYLWEKAKALFVGAIIAAPLAAAVYYFIVTYQGRWWIPAGILLFLFSVVAGRLAPTLIFPLFYRFVPVKDQNLVNLVRERCESVGMKIEGVFQFDLSKTTRKANAAFTGMGKSKRVILSDTLLDELNREEIDAVLSHELGHFKLKHLRKLVVFGTVSTFLGLYLVSATYGRFIDLSEFQGIDQLAPLPVLAALVSFYSFVMGPVQNMVSRFHERAADQFSTRLVGDPAPMIAALNGLAERNLADRDPHPIVEFLFHSHPSVRHRIERLQGRPPGVVQTKPDS
ncbi:MAG: M48 family metallopeptidase [Fidelibacterota bacterium]